MSRYGVLAALGLAIGLMTSPASAQFVGAQSQLSTVAETLAQAKDDQWVSLQGHIVRQIKHETYIFEDATGSMQIEVDDKVFAGQRVEAQTLVQIEGEFEREAFEPNQLDVKRLRVVPKTSVN